jgi:transcriptional regulator with XRE-family HTH domain
MSLATKLAELRSKKHMSLQQVADRVDVSKALIWELEKGRIANPSMEVISRLASLFEVSIDGLMDNSRLDPEDQSFEEEALVFYKDFKKLPPEVQEVLRNQVQLFKAQMNNKK